MWWSYVLTHGVHGDVYDVFVHTLAEYNVQFGVVGDRALEKISVDQSQNVVQYHVTEISPQRDNSQVWAISDFNRVSNALTVKFIRNSWWATAAHSQESRIPVQETRGLVLERRTCDQQGTS